MVISGVLVINGILALTFLFLLPLLHFQILATKTSRVLQSTGKRCFVVRTGRVVLWIPLQKTLLEGQVPAQEWNRGGPPKPSLFQIAQFCWWGVELRSFCKPQKFAPNHFQISCKLQMPTRWRHNILYISSYTDGNQTHQLLPAHSGHLANLLAVCWLGSRQWHTLIEKLVWWFFFCCNIIVFLKNDKRDQDVYLDQRVLLSAFPSATSNL